MKLKYKINKLHKIMLVVILLMLLVVINTNVYASTNYKTKTETTIYVVNEEAGISLGGQTFSVATDQEFEANETRETVNINGSAINVIEVRSDTILTTSGVEVMKKSGETWFIPVNDISEISDIDISGGEGATGGYGSSGSYGLGTVVVHPSGNDEEEREDDEVLADLTKEEELDRYKPEGVTGAVTLSEKTNVIVGIIQAVGTVISVIILTIIAIRYMISSVEEKAEYKETMVPYIIGAGSLLVVSNFVGIIYSIIENINI